MSRTGGQRHTRTNTPAHKTHSFRFEDFILLLHIAIKIRKFGAHMSDVSWQEF